MSLLSLLWRLDGLVRFVLRVPVYLYRWFVAPLLRPGCRFEPSCSSYALGALVGHWSVMALWLIARRLGKCQPWGGCGADPVPPGPAVSSNR